MIRDGITLQIYSWFGMDPMLNTALLSNFISEITKKKDSAKLFVLSYDPDTIILGNMQNKKDFRIDKAQKDGVKLVRRHTGGTGVYTTKDDFLYHLAIGRDCFEYDVKKYMRVLCAINDMFIGAFDRLGVSTQQAKFIPHSKIRSCDCFATSDRCELIVEDKRKVHGSAYKFTGAVYFQEGAIPVVNKYNNITKYYTKMVDPKTSPVSVHDLLGSSITNTMIADAVIEEFSNLFSGIEYGTVTEDELIMANEIKDKFEVN